MTKPTSVPAVCPHCKGTRICPHCHGKKLMPNEHPENKENLAAGIVGYAVPYCEACHGSGACSYCA